MEGMQAFLEREKKRLSCETVRAYERELALFDRRFSSVEARKIRREDVASYLTSRATSAASMARAGSVLRAYFSFLKETGIRADCPVDQSGARFVKSPPRVAEWERKEFFYRHFEEGLYGLRARAMIALLGDTGMRVSDLVRLTVSDFTVDPPRITFGTKKTCAVLCRETAECVLQYCFAKGGNGDTADAYLFTSRTASPLSRQSVWLILRRHAARCGIDAPVSPRIIRAWHQENAKKKDEI